MILIPFVTIEIEDPNTNAGRTNCKKNRAKKKMVIYDSMKYKLMSMITPLNTTKEFFDTLTNIYEKKDPTQKRTLKNKLLNLNMEKDEIVASFFSNISLVRDQQESIYVVMDVDELFQTTIGGILPHGILSYKH